MARYHEEDSVGKVDVVPPVTGPNPAMIVTVEIPILKPLPQRSAARQAGNKFAKQLESSPEKTPAKKRRKNNDVSDVDDNVSDSSPQTKKKSRVNAGSKSLGSAAAAKVTSRSSSLTSPSASSTLERKGKGKIKQYKSRAKARFQPKTVATRRRSNSVASDDLSSSLSPPPKVVSPPRESTVARSKAKRSRPSAFDRSDQGSDNLQQSPSKRHKTHTKPQSRISLPNPLPSPLLLDGIKKSPKKAPPQLFMKRAHSPIGLAQDTSSGKVVWARVDSDGKILSDDIMPSDGVAYWWPAEIAANGSDYRTINVIGAQPPNIDGQKIDKSADSVLMSFRTHNPRTPSIRFTEHNFVTPRGEPSNSPGSASQDIISRWKIAYKKALDLDAEDNDDLPDFVAISQTSARKPTANREPDVTDLSDDVVDPQASPTFKSTWKPDPYLEVDSFGVARFRGGTYWPVKVLSVIMPTSNKRGAEGKYEVLFFDGERKKISSRDILSVESLEFLTCKMGAIKSEGNDEDTEDESRLRATPLPRSPSPAPRTIAPSEDEFAELSLRQQMSLVFPVLERIIQGDYPQSNRHNEFIAGGKRRNESARNFVKGDLTQHEIEVVGRQLRRWVLRGERWRLDQPNDEDEASSAADAEKMGDPAGLGNTSEFDFHALTPSQQYPRVRGCEAYENLSQSERSQYCSEVLLPEALIQLHIWRRALKPGPITRPTDEEEAELYTKAKAGLAAEKSVDAWVDYVLSLRSQRRIAKGIPPDSGRGSDRGRSVELGATRSRKRYH